MDFLSSIVDSYNDVMSQRDPRTDGWLLMSSPFPTVFISLTYVFIVTKLGPWLMRDRKPFELRNSIILYNIVQVAGSVYLFYKALKHAWGGRYSFTCQMVDYSDDPEELIVAELCWWYYFSKFTEFMDTFFFVLRKKYDQVTTLHVIHHGVMPAAVWWGVKFVPGGHATFFGTLNTFVHIVMYTYYLLASFGPRFQKYLWWKKHLTLFQMIQFVMVAVHSAQVFFNGCPFNRYFSVLMLSHALMFLGLFSNFYLQAYIKRRRLPQSFQKVEAAKAVVVKSAPVKSENQESTIVQSLFKNVMEGSSSACFIGQEDLYKEKGKKAGYGAGGHSGKKDL